MGDFLELAWKDGQLVMRGRSSSPSCISYSSHHQSPTSQVKKEIYPMHPAKRPNLEKAYSISDGNPLLDLPGVLDKLGSSPTPGIPSRGTPVPQLETCRKCQLDEPNSKDQFRGSMGGLANSNLKQVGSSGPEKHFGFRNFSLFLRPEVLKAYGQNNVATRPSNGPSSLRLEELRRSSKEQNAPLIGSSNHPIESSSMEPASSLKGCQDYLADQPMATKTEPIAKLVKLPPPDEQSEDFVNKNAIASKRSSDQYFGLNSSSPADKIKGRPDMGKGIDNQLTGTSSMCSRGASNDVTCCLRSGDEDFNEGIADASENDEEEQERVTKLGGNKRKQAAGHSLSEKMRREKINKRLRALQDLLPNSNKVDEASMLDEAIEYIKTLQLQLQIMSVGLGLHNQLPPMMLTNGLSHLQAPQLAPLQHPMAAGFGATIPMSTSPMLGLAGPQMIMPMSTLSVAQALPLIGGGLQRQLPVPVPGIYPPDLLGPAPSLICSKDHNADKINSKVLNTSGSRIRESNQAIRGSSKR